MLNLYAGIYEMIDDQIRCGALTESGTAPFGRGAEIDFNFFQTLAMELPSAADFTTVLEKGGWFSTKLTLSSRDMRNVDSIGGDLFVLSDAALMIVEEDITNPRPNPSWGGFQPQNAAEDELYGSMLRSERCSMEEDDPLKWLYPRNLIQALTRLRPLIESERLFVVPKHGFYPFDAVGEFDVSFHAHGVQLPANVLSSLKGRTADEGSTSLGLNVPKFQGTSLKMLAAFREDHAVHFEGFHRELRSLMAATEKAGTNGAISALSEIIREVNYQIMRLDEAYRRTLRKSLKLTALEFGFLTTGLVLYGTLPGELSRLLAAALGGATVRGIMQRLATDHVDRSSPFYVAWKLHDTYIGSRSNSEIIEF